MIKHIYKPLVVDKIYRYCYYREYIYYNNNDNYNFLRFFGFSRYLAQF